MALDPLRVPSVSQRPSSSLSTRSVSRASQRPTSRLSQRTIVRQPRIAALLKTLVQQITNVEEECAMEDIQEAMSIATKRIDQMKHATLPSPKQVDAHFKGHIRKARIHVQDAFADALQMKLKELEQKVNVKRHEDSDVDIKPSTFFYHLHFLLLLSSPPTTSTLAQADAILARNEHPVSDSQGITWENILKEEPFEGQHWQGAYGLPRGSTVGCWEEEGSDSGSLSIPSDAEYVLDDVTSDEDDSEPQLPNIASTHTSVPQSFKSMHGRNIVEALHARQYWRSGWDSDVACTRGFDVGEPSTLGVAMNRLIGPKFLPQPLSINEVDTVREVLMILQGRESPLFDVGPEHNVKVSTDRRIAHLTNTSQSSILGSFSVHASTLNPLRHLVKGTIPFQPAMETQCRTFEAFSAAIERQLRKFDAWCANKEECIGLSHRGEYHSQHITSLLSLKQEVEFNMAGTFTVLLHIARTIQSKRAQHTPAQMSALILNMLLEATRARLATNDNRTAQAVMDVWRESAEPLWWNLEQWLKDGIPIRSEFEGRNTVEPTWDKHEFFIRINPLVDIDSPDFWEDSYTLLSRHNEPIASTLGGERMPDESYLPVFLAHVAEDILAAGKAIGILRAINMIHLIADDWLSGWIKFQRLAVLLPLEGLDVALENLISDTLLASCQLAQSWLHRVLVEECKLWTHLHAVENVCLMTRGDAMSQFGERLFTRIDSCQPWNDFHFLNTAFREVTSFGTQPWINASLVRFTHRGNKDRNISRTVRAIDGLAIEYTVPFPLVYMFGPENSTSYSSLFCFLLQIRRAKSVLDRILIRGFNNGIPNQDTTDLKVFYVLRGKLSWFVNTFMNFIMTNVIHTGLLEFHQALREAGSLDEMISVHRSHLERLLARCLLRHNTAALHRAILSILDLTLHFSDCLSAFAGDTSLDISRHSLVLMRHRHRGRVHGRRRQKPDVIGFAGTRPYLEGDSNSSSDDGDEEPDVETSAISSMSLAGDGFLTRLDRMNQDLDGLVRFVRRGVESLATGTGDVSTTFGVLAFCLEDWE